MLVAQEQQWQVQTLQRGGFYFSGSTQQRQDKSSQTENSVHTRGSSITKQHPANILFYFILSMIISLDKSGYM